MDNIENPASKKWKIEKIILTDRASYFEWDVQFEFRVINKRTGKIFKSFWREEYERSGGSQDSGAKSVEFSEDGKHIIVKYEEGKVETHKLP